MLRVKVSSEEEMRGLFEPGNGSGGYAMNAIILCSHRLERQSADREAPTCLTALGGLPVLAYILAGLARLCLTRIILAVPSSGARRIKALSASLLPRTLVSYAPCPGRVRHDSIAAVASALRFAEPTGLLLVNGNCIFGTDLAGRVAGTDVGILPYVVEESRARREGLLSMASERIESIGMGIAPEAAAGRALGLRFLPRCYLPALRGVLVELTAAGASEAPFSEAMRVMIERGYRFCGINAAGALFAEIEAAGDLPFAAGVALELQRRDGLGKYAARKGSLGQPETLRTDELSGAPRLPGGRVSSG